MAAVDVDVVQSALRDVNLSSGRETVLKPEQESAVRALLADRDVLAVLRTGSRKSLIYQMFVRAKNYELNGNAAILVISSLKSIIEDQLQEMELLGYPAKDLANLSNDDIRRSNLLYFPPHSCHNKNARTAAFSSRLLGD
ncbi:putative ATP-dependent DNA helicase Q1 [Porites lutea]|uniref:putative ATP-dependent DNA helicase Q1 n=1 Tax=Porites lutea TaxID=51062 RepID=UPI003CC66F72